MMLNKEQNRVRVFDIAPYFSGTWFVQHHVAKFGGNRVTFTFENVCLQLDLPSEMPKTLILFIHNLFSFWGTETPTLTYNSFTKIKTMLHGTLESCVNVIYLACKGLRLSILSLFLFRGTVTPTLTYNSFTKILAKTKLHGTL